MKLLDMSCSGLFFLTSVHLGMVPVVVVVVVVVVCTTVPESKGKILLSSFLPSIMKVGLAG